MQSMGWSVLMLLLVVCLIPVSLGAFKRLQGLRVPGALRQMDIVAQLQLGPRERMLLVRVQNRLLVLGVTAQQVSLLGEADVAGMPVAPGESQADGAQAPATGFALVLQNCMAAARAKTGQS